MVYKIADHLIRLQGEDLVSLVSRMEGFAPFAVDDADAQSSVLTITTEGTDAMLVPAMVDELYTFDADDDSELHSAFGTTAQGYIFSMSTPEGVVLRLWCAREAKVAYIKSRLQNDAMSMRTVRFAIWIAFGMAVSHLDTIPVHTSTITYRGRNVLFLGESGTGKSTHTRMWRENIEGATLLNDDGPMVRVIDGVAYVYGSPWSGKTPCYKNERYPLAGCVRLSQAPYNKIRKLSVIEAYAAIHPSCPPDFAYDDYLYDGISATLDKLLGLVPFYHLECLPDAAAAQLSCKTIFG